MEFLLFNILLLDYRRSWNSWNKWKSIWHFQWIEVEVAFFTAISLFLSILCNSTKKPAKWKKHSVSIFFPFPPLGKILLVWFEFFPSYLSRKKEPWEHFSASDYGLGFKNFFVGTLFSTSVTWEKLKSDVDKLCLRRGKNKYRNKILLLGLIFFLSK